MPQQPSDLKNRVARLGGEALWVIAGQALSVLLMFAGVRLMTQVMSPSEYGKLAILMSIANGVMYSLGQAFKLSATRFFSVMQIDANPNWYWDLIKNGVGWIVGSSGGILLIILMVTSLADLGWQAGLTFSTTTLLAMVLLLNAIFYGVYNGARERKIFVFHQVLFDGTRFLFAFLLAYLLSGAAMDAMTGFVISGLLVLISHGYFLKKLKQRFYLRDAVSSEQSQNRQVYAYITPLILGGILGWIQIFSDRWAIKFLSSYADVGIYFALYQTMYSFWIYATSTLDNFLGTILFSRIKDGKNPKEHLRMLRLNEMVTAGYLLLVLCCFFILIPLKGILSRFLFAEEYRAVAASLLPWMALSGGIYGIGQQMIYSVYGGLTSYKIIPVRTAGAVLAVGFHLAGAFFWGLEGVVFAGLGFSVCFMITAVMVHMAEKKRIAVLTG